MHPVVQGSVYCVPTVCQTLIDAVIVRQLMGLLLVFSFAILLQTLHLTEHLKHHVCQGAVMYFRKAGA